MSVESILSIRRRRPQYIFLLFFIPKSSKRGPFSIYSVFQLGLIFAMKLPFTYFYVPA